MNCEMELNERERAAIVLKSTRPYQRSHELKSIVLRDFKLLPFIDPSLEFHRNELINFVMNEKEKALQIIKNEKYHTLFKEYLEARVSVKTFSSMKELNQGTVRQAINIGRMRVRNFINLLIIKYGSED